MAIRAGAKPEVVVVLRSRTEVEDALNAAKMVTFRENVQRLVSAAIIEDASNVERKVIWPENALTHKHSQREVDVDAVVVALAVNAVEAPEPATSARKKAIWHATVLRLVEMTTETKAELTKDQGEMTTATKLLAKTHGATQTSKRMAGVHQVMQNGEINAN